MLHRRRAPGGCRLGVARRFRRLPARFYRAARASSSVCRAGPVRPATPRACAALWRRRARRPARFSHIVLFCGNLPPFSITLRRNAAARSQRPRLMKPYFFAHRQYLALFARKRQIQIGKNVLVFAGDGLQPDGAQRAQRAATPIPWQTGTFRLSRMGPPQSVFARHSASHAACAPPFAAMRRMEARSVRPPKNARKPNVAAAIAPARSKSSTGMHAQREGGDQSQTAADGKNGKADERDERMALLRRCAQETAQRLFRGGRALEAFGGFVHCFHPFSSPYGAVVFSYYPACGPRCQTAIRLGWLSLDRRLKAYYNILCVCMCP